MVGKNNKRKRGKGGKGWERKIITKGGTVVKDMTIKEESL